MFNISRRHNKMVPSRTYSAWQYRIMNEYKKHCYQALAQAKRYIQKGKKKLNSCYHIWEEEKWEPMVLLLMKPRQQKLMNQQRRKVRLLRFTPHQVGKSILKPQNRIQNW